MTTFRLRAAATLFALAFVFFIPSSGQAATVQFTVSDLADAVPGADLWQYDFSVSGATFNVDDGLALFFDPSLYADLTNTFSSSDWDVLVLQPDTSLPDDGVYDALSLASPASLAVPFSMTFQWLGGANRTPGSVSFEVYRLDDAGIIEVLEEGRTRAPGGVPEPATLWLAATALGALGVRRVRRTTR